MSELAIIDNEEGGTGPGEREVSLADIVQAHNLVPMLEPSFVNEIGSKALDELEIDKKSREDWLKRYDRAMDLAMQVTQEKTFPWPNASNVKFPLLTQASIQFNARAYPAIIPGSNLVKGKVLGPDIAGEKLKRADRVASYMTWQLLYDVPGWEDDTDKLLLRLPIIGCVFRKSWFDGIQNRIMIETIPARDFVVNYWSPGLDKAPRYTHVQRYYPHEIEEYVRSGLWEAFDWEGKDDQDPMSLVEVYEQFRLIDMDGDGYPEPYVVTFSDRGSVARIVACFDMSGVTQGQDGTILRIERKKYFTKYGFIPAPDGSFYDIGFGTLLDNISASIDTILNQLIDAGTLANMQGGFLAGGVKIKGGSMRFTPGEWKRVEGPSAGPLKDSIVPLQLKEPSSVLFQLLGLLIEAAKDITSVQDILTGSQDSQTAPTTALALIEQGQKVFTAIYKRIHRAFGEDLRIQAGLNRDFLDGEAYANLNDQPITVTREDFEDKSLDIVPVSDPTAVNDMQKMAKAQVLMAHNGDPLVNQLEIRRRQFEAAGIEDIKTLLSVPPPQPDPKTAMEIAKQASVQQQTEADVKLTRANTIKALMDAALSARQAGETSAEQIILAEAQAALAKLTSGDDDEGDQGGMGGVGEEAGDAGLSPVPQGPGPDAGDGMGAALLAGGPSGDAGGPIPGGDAG